MRDDDRRRPPRTQVQRDAPRRDRGSKRLIFRRTVILMLLCGVCTFVPLLRQLWVISIDKHDEYSRKATNQQTKDVSVTADRGRILDANGKVLAMSATVYKLILSPLDVQAKVRQSSFKDADGKLDQAAYDAAVEARRQLLIDGVCSILGTSREKVEKHMSNTKSQYEVVATNIEKEQADQLREFMVANKCGFDLYLTPDSKRYYPNGDLASHVVGFVNAEGGAYGIESVFESTLKGTAGRVLTTKTGLGTEMYDTYSEFVDAVNGYDVNLTIDATIQSYAEKALEEGIKAFDAQRGGFCLVIDPRTGAVLAMASSPDYDLNSYSAVIDPMLQQQVETSSQTYLQEFLKSPDHLDKTQEEIAQAARSAALTDARNRQWRSQALNDTYEPGSTFKALVLAAALEEGVISEKNTYFCPGFYVVNGTRINCSKLTGHKSQTLAEAVQNSCNPAFMQIGQALGAEKFYDYFEAFGLKASTGIELVGEGSGQVWDRKYLSSAEGYLSLATASFGQRFTVTPLQMITGFAATINGGRLLQPHVVKSITAQDGTLLESTQVDMVRQVVSQKTSDTTRAILESVVSEGTGGKAYVPGYRIGGKTGTSETTIPGEVVVSFMGFAPADDPQVLVLLAYNTPKRKSEGNNYSTTGTYISGGNMAAPKAGPLIAEILDYLGVEKKYTDGEAATADAQVPKVIGSTVDTAISTLTKKGFKYRTVGQGDTVTAQIPAPGASIPASSTVVLYLGGEVPPESGTVPNVTGLGYDSAKSKLESAGFFMKASGATTYYGTATKAQSQSVANGESAPLGTVISVVFSSPEVEDGFVSLDE